MITALVATTSARPLSLRSLRKLASVFGRWLMPCAVVTAMIGLGQNDKIFWPVVVLDSVDVMHVFGSQEQAPDGALGDKPMFEDVALEESAARIGVIGRPHVHVAVRRVSTSLEVPMRWAGLLDRRVAVHESRRVSNEVASFHAGDSRDSRFATATTLAESVWNFVGRRHVTSFHFSSLTRMETL